MTTPSQQLSELICTALNDSAVLTEKESVALKSRILSGKIKPEDWYLAVEKSIAEKEKGSANG